MASLLLKSECVNLEQRLYKMTWWATALNQIVVPSGMNMCGGSIAVITAGNNVNTYVYNSNTNAWKQKTGGDAQLKADVEQLKADVNRLNTTEWTFYVESPELEYGMINNVEVEANSTATFSVEFTHDWTDFDVPYVFFSFYTTNATAGRLANYEVGLTGRTRTGFSGVIVNNDSSARTPVIYWLAITKRYYEDEELGD